MVGHSTRNAQQGATMNTKQQVNKLWDEMREAINKAYNAKPNDDETYALRD